MPMPVNKMALIRYKTIDKCLQNRRRKWTLEDLMEACSDALQEYEGVARGVSRRAIQMDLQTMRSEKLGYNAPIVVTDKKYYTYEDADYSINKTPLTAQDLGTLNEVLGVLRQFNTFGYFQELNSIVTRLEDKLYKQQHEGRSYVDFEKNELLKGLSFLEPLHKAIQQQKTLRVGYQSFKRPQADDLIFYPWLLKEYRNRWFLFGKSQRNKVVLFLALDRIQTIETTDLAYIAPDFDVHDYFGNVIGVSKYPTQVAHTIVLQIHKDHAPYIKTKPMHASQKILRDDERGMIFSIKVVWNFELERELLGFGELLQVLAPARLVKKMLKRHTDAMNRYTQPTSNNSNAEGSQ